MARGLPNILGVTGGPHLGLSKGRNSGYVGSDGGRYLRYGGSAMIVIDLMGDSDDVIQVRPEETPEELSRKEAMRQHALEEIFRRAPQPQLIPAVPVK